MSLNVLTKDTRKRYLNIRAESIKLDDGIETTDLTVNQLTFAASGSGNVLNRYQDLSIIGDVFLDDGSIPFTGTLRMSTIGNNGVLTLPPFSFNTIPGASSEVTLQLQQEPGLPTSNLTFLIPIKINGVVTLCKFDYSVGAPLNKIVFRTGLTGDIFPANTLVELDDAYHIAYTTN